MRGHKASLALSCALALLVGCQSAPQAHAESAPRHSAKQSVRPMREVGFNTTSGLHRFVLETATTPAEQARGLMFRKSLAPEGGMLFVFDSDMPRQFWMKHTYIPLDMIFVDHAMRVVGIVEAAEPQTLDERGPKAACRYVVELQGGTTRRLALKTGDVMTLAEVLQ